MERYEIMNLEEKIQKKEKRKNSLKKLRIPIIIVIILLVMALIVGYFWVAKQKTQETGNEATVEGQEKIVVDENQTVGEKIGENKILYKDYIYTYTTDFKIEITRQKTNGEESAQNVLSYQLQGSSQGDVYIYKDKIYFEADGRLKSFSMDGSSEEEFFKDLRIDEPQFDFNKELIYFTYYEDRNDYDNGIGIAKFTTGEVIKKISTKNEKGSVKIINSDDTNLYYSVNEDTYDVGGNEVEVTLYSLNKETFESKKIKTETISSGWSSSGIYDVKTNGDYLYYTVGSQQGTLIVFYGKVACIKKDGTDYKELAELASELGEIPELVIHKDYLYFEGYRVNLANNQVEEDEFKHGDKIDEDDFVYTASLSDGKTMTIAKYKVGTSFEGLEKIYSKDIQEGLAINTDKIDIDIQKDRIYLSFSYYDNNTENWRPMDAGGETYSMKKDGSDLKQIN